ncbi:MAG: bifunctional phosphoribosylaminoimidazolecarboxamide formyltransferase/IMP cyclohydrolase [Deltaproteobacteria bacterium]|nr:bifunctional phosphoribosylaminoimidazolecarboxamide formyltransferase/IMP cyclohydrolase [Deltaproteobacteria bacterium]
MRRRAVLSVSDKRGIVELARRLSRVGFEIVSTGGTARALRDAGVGVVDVADVTGFPEMMDGRVKTLHPKVHAGILARRDHVRDRAALEKNEIVPIDVVVVNLYPFEATVDAGHSEAETIEHGVDIGGPSMVRAAAKNFFDVVVLVDPDDYEEVGREIEVGTTLLRRRQLAAKAFDHTARTDAAIANWFRGDVSESPYGTREAFPLRYGENPHQEARFVRAAGLRPHGFAASNIIQGKALSYNNLLDADAALRLARDFDLCAAVVVKHTNPCGVAVSRAGDVAAAYRAAREGDPVSAFGGVVALNRAVDAAAAACLAETFLEVVVAPSFEAGARERLAAKKNLRLVELPDFARGDAWELRSVTGGVLVMEADSAKWSRNALRVVTKRSPEEVDWGALELAWRTARVAKSNAIVLANGDSVVGVGAGQMSRVDSCRIAVEKAGAERARHAAAASDAFFPFPDGVEVLAKSGVGTVVQPGGSVKDDEVVAAADALGIAMVFTGTRHFRH